MGERGNQHSNGIRPGLPSWLSTISPGLWAKQSSDLEASVSACKTGTASLRALLALTPTRGGGEGSGWMYFQETLGKTNLIDNGQKPISGCST